jgi:glycosyltransferase involved in cell wall biosynthesis
MCGLTYATGDVVIPIDVDLQDPLEVVPQLIAKYNEGFEVVLAKRVDRSSDSYIKRETAKLFYKLHNLVSKPKIEENVGDFRLLSRKIVNHIIAMPEANLFMKGILSFAGGKTAIVEYTRDERIAGETKFNIWKLYNLAWEGLTSFSTFPIRVFSFIGFVLVFLTIIYSLFIFIKALIIGDATTGFPTLYVTISLLGSLQIIGLGFIGEYVGRIYLETKRRPRWILKDSIDRAS